MKISRCLVLVAVFSAFAFAGGGPPPPAPEVSAGYIPGALVLVGGAVLMIRAKLRK